jgi:hypothetical protein
MKVIYNNPKVLANKGIYFKFILGLKGSEIDRTKRFKKWEHIQK